MNWEQLKTIFWLRGRLARNQWARSKGVGAVIAGIVAFSVVMMGTASFAVMLVIGSQGLGKVKPDVLWFVWAGLTAGFLFMWMVGLMMEIQRSESIDLQRLMHLPVALGQIFTINYVASHLATSIVVFVPAMMGLTLGLTISRGPSMLLLGPLALGLVCMVTAWTYCLRGWLAALMSNPRRRRTVVMFMMMAFILLGQAPNLYFNVIRRFDQPARSASREEVNRRHSAEATKNKELFEGILAVQEFVPPLWLAAGARALAQENALPALGGILGCFAIGGLGLWRAYRGTLRFYRGDGKVTAEVKTSRAPAAAATTTAAKPGRRFLELELPWVPEQAAALALATFRSLVRAPEVKMAWATSILIPLIVGGSLLYRRNGIHIPEAAKPFAATGAMVFSVFMMVQFFANQFGFDRDGFRALVLSPVDRKFILLGKNLASLPVGTGFGLLLLLLIVLRFQLSIDVAAAALLQLIALLFLAGLVGNVLSIMVPYRIQQGTMKPTKMPAMAMVVLMLCHLFFPIAMSPVFVPALAAFGWEKLGWPSFVPVNLILSAVLAALTATAYWQTLDPLSRLLQRRETKILGIVTVEVD